ncbi:pilus assembly protein PilW [Photobacterium gaetbulicola]|uniref:Type IV pilus assembly protein PilW n=1 Tax=Photobacterium gaetbulicola Gung47 TaxID=658445 RepID=A0A0C5WRK6_9GAMM|nr:prepilin-type N-terminal cleavage/methylation domain-containing protein [Photobacterium gaetbulicola]AJR09763.1 hypothetical protein H744_2c3119 [Photobacterium gaetbulicola Gung47]PSU12281.1 pilus assembly protein PilW [Photobacterium gaetbulicola]
MVSAHKISRGYSLIELVVATAMSLLVLAAVTSIFMSGFSSASQRSLQLMLAQDTNDALRMIKDDILRAGFASGASSTFLISGATNTVYLDAPMAGKSHCIGYGYSDGSNEYYRSYYLEDEKLNIYMTESSVMTAADACKKGHSALDYQRLKVTKFEVEEKLLGSGGATSQLLTISLDVSTLDNTVIASKNVIVKTRNWN